MGVIAKFRCIERQERWTFPVELDDGSVTDEVAVEIKMRPVYADGGTVKNKGGTLFAANAVEENRIFGLATPAGDIAMLIKNRGAAEQFEVGRAYYVTFEPADG